MQEYKSSKNNTRTIANRPIDVSIISLLSSQASDEGNRFDEATVKINITDANTHRPHFDQSLYNVKVSEDDPPGTLIYTALATGKSHP